MTNFTPPNLTPILGDPIALPAKEKTQAHNLAGMTKDEMRAALAPLVQSERDLKMRLAQLWQWTYAKGVRGFDEMTNLSKAFRESLASNFTLERLKVVNFQLSEDGTRKYLLRVGGNHEVEMVYIPDVDRGTLCISSQIGCTLTCSFCHTGTQKLVRNLNAAEIIGQIILARDDLDDWPKGGERAGENRKITNIVLMGMGEPLYNFENVRDAMKVIMDPDGIAMSRRRVTLSTSGVVPEIIRAGAEIGSLLAISLHATTDEVRNQLVPINRRWNIEALLNACRQYPKLSNSERITFEYVMLNGVNDSDEDARRLVELIAGIPAKINLIPFNAWPGTKYTRSSNNRIHKFAEIIQNAGYASPVRTPRGEDILAACGQLKSATERERKSKAEIEAELE